MQFKKHLKISNLLRNTQSKHNHSGDSKRILKRNLISSNIKPFKRQRLNDNPSSRSLYKNQKYLSTAPTPATTKHQFPSINGGFEQSTAFKLLQTSSTTPNTNRFSINHLTTNSVGLQPPPPPPQPSQTPLNKPNHVNQLYAAALSHLSQSANNGHNSSHIHHHHHPQQQQQQLFFAAAAAASNPYLNTNRLFAPYLLDNQHQHQKQSHHIFHTPIKRRRTKVTDTRLSPRTSSLNLSQLSKSTSNLLTQTASPSIHDQDTTEYAEENIVDNELGGGDSNCEQIYNHDDIVEDNDVDDEDDEDKQQSLHSTNDGLLNVYSTANENDDQQQSSDYTGYQISFLNKNKINF